MRRPRRALLRAATAVLLGVAAVNTVTGTMASLSAQDRNPSNALSTGTVIIGDNSRAVSILTRLLQTSYGGWLYSPTPITPALLRLDPLWDPLRADPAFQRLCEGKQP